MKVLVKNNDPIKAYKLLNRKLHDENVFVDYKEHEFYKSKGERFREKRKRAISRQRKEKAKREAILKKLETQIIRGNNDRNNKPGRPTNRNKLASTSVSRNTKSKAS